MQSEVSVITRSINFPDELMERLQAVADKKYITVSSVVVMACAEFVEKEEQQNQGNNEKK